MAITVVSRIGPAQMPGLRIGVYKMSRGMFYALAKVDGAYLPTYYRNREERDEDIRRSNGNVSAISAELAKKDMAALLIMCANYSDVRFDDGNVLAYCQLHNKLKDYLNLKPATLVGMYEHMDYHDAARTVREVRLANGMGAN